MIRALRALSFSLAGACVFVGASAEQASPPAPIAIAKIAYVDDLVERQARGEGWVHVTEGMELRIGDRLRTGRRGSARIDFPWMSVALAGSSQLSVPSSLVLSTVLEEGRVEQTAPRGEIIKLVTTEARIRGEGRVVVRRENGRTLVSAVAGAFRIEGAGKPVSLASGQGTIVATGRTPSAPVPLTPAPTALDPGDDPLYVLPNQPVTLRFASSARSHHVEITTIDSNQVLLQRELSTGPASVVIPWEGTFRWRVSARDKDGLEGLPSREGLIAVVAR